MGGATAGPAAVLTRSSQCLIPDCWQIRTSASSSDYLRYFAHSLAPAGLIQLWPVSLRASEESAVALRVTQRMALTL